MSVETSKDANKLSSLVRCDQGMGPLEPFELVADENLVSDMVVT